MIVSDKYKFIIANPPKTGTTSLHGLVDGWAKKGGDPAVLSHLRGETITRHRLAPPWGKEHYARYMVVRHPVARLASMYEFFRLRKRDAKWIAPDIQRWEATVGREAAWVEFLRRLVEIRNGEGYMDAGRRGVHGINPYMWVDSQTEMADYMRGLDIDGSRLSFARGRVRLLYLEKFNAGFGALCVRHGVRESLSVGLPRRNAVPDDERLFPAWQQYLMVEGAPGLVRELIGDEDYG